MQFPWVCISLKEDYSGKLKQCFTSPTKYMSVKEESEFTTESLNIALEAKMRKQLLLKEKEPKRLTSEPSLLDATRHTNKTRLKRDHTLIQNSSHNRTALEKMVSPEKLKARTSAGERLQPTFMTQLPFKPIEELREHGSLPSIRSALRNDIVRDLRTIEESNLSLRRKVDELSHKNINLAKRMRELQNVEINMNLQGNSCRKVDEYRAQIKALAESMDRIKQRYCYSLLEKERLNILIRICKENKTQNE